MIEEEHGDNSDDESKHEDEPRENKRTAEAGENSEDRSVHEGEARDNQRVESQAGDLEEVTKTNND